MKMKMVIDLCVKHDIEKIVCDWAVENEFVKCSKTYTENLVDINNVTYCYNRIQEKAKTIITIHQLDDIVRIQAWICDETEQEKRPMHSINELLLMLGHMPIA